MRFAWNQTYSVGVAEIDEQHRRFVDIINATHDLLEQEDVSLEAVRLILGELTEYGLFHFATEEQYFRQYNYAYASSHMREHDAFRRKILRFVEELQAEEERGNLVAHTEKILDLAVEWLCDHIVREDKKFVRAMK